MGRTSQSCRSRLPDNTALKQQRLPAYRLHLSATKVLSGFFATGAFCLGIGIVLILSAKSIKEIEINYTNICANCAELRENAINFDKECTCSIPFYLPDTMQGNVYMYYKLYGFHQNLYRYILSRSNSQLMGRNVKDVGSCDSFRKTHNGTPICPCGAIANSIFNDTIILSYNLNSSIHIKVPMLSSGITWWTDKFIKFQNPNSNNLPSAFAASGDIDVKLASFNCLQSSFVLMEPIHQRFPLPTKKNSNKKVKLEGNSFDLNEKSCPHTDINGPSLATQGTAKPPHWPKPVYELDEEDSGNSGFINEDFIVWMRTAAFPTFKKLHRRLNRTQYFTEGLPAGNYSFNITYNFPVTRFQGEKSVVLSTLTWSGGSGLFLGLAYTVTGAMTWLASFSMMAIHLMQKERKMFLSSCQVKL